MSCIVHKRLSFAAYILFFVLLSNELAVAEFHIDHVDVTAPVNLSQDVRLACPIQEPNINLCLSPEQIVFILTNADAPGPVLLQDVLQNDMYHVTYPLNFRNPLTIPSTSPLFQARPYCNYSVTVKPFINLMNKANFTPCSTQILSYLTLLTDRDFLELLVKDDFAPLNIPEVLALLGNITEQQREAGFMFFAQGNAGRFTWSLALPLLYFQHNFFLTQEEQDVLNKKTFFTGIGTKLASRDLDNFINDHLINEVISSGDLRLDFWYNSPHESAGKVAIGAQLTLPTAHAFIKNLSSACQKRFDRQEPMPYVDLQLLMNLGLCQNIVGSAINLTELIADYSIAALDRLGSILLNNVAGDQHVNFGPTLHVTYDCAEYATFDLIAEGAYYLPSRETRLFKTNKTILNFYRDYDNTADALKNLNFLSQQATDTLYPTSVDIRVKPGMMGHVAASFTARRSVFTATVGYDFWCRSQEALGQIYQRYTPANANYIPGLLDIQQGTRPAAHQGKVFAALSGEIYQQPCGGTCSTSRVGIRGDYTLHRRAIGRDFTISLDFIMDF